MSIKIRRLFWILPLFLLLVFGLLSLVASAWLESSGGRHMLQNSLSSSLGVPVQLAGDYDLRLFPRIRFTGSELNLEHVEADTPFASIDEFSAVIELLPFIHKEIRISSIQFSGGFLDLPSLLDSTAPAEPGGSGEPVLPSVKLILLKDFTIRLDKAGKRIYLQELRLEDFQPGQEAFLDLRASVSSGEGELGKVSARTGLLINPVDLSLSLAINDMEFTWGDISLERLEGALDWSPQGHALSLDLSFPVDDLQASVLLNTVIEDSVTGTIQLKYPHPPPALPSSLDAQFEYKDEYLEAVPIEVMAAGQQISGRGCVILTEKPGLNLMLEAQELDLDEIYRLLPESEEGAAEFSIDLAIHLRVDKAWYSGAEARQLDVLVGEAPGCDRPASLPDRQ